MAVFKCATKVQHSWISYSHKSKKWNADWANSQQKCDGCTKRMRILGEVIDTALERGICFQILPSTIYILQTHLRINFLIK